MTSDRPEGLQVKEVKSWTVADAEAKLSEVIARAESEGPQTISRNGRDAVVVVAVEEWERTARRSGSLREFFAASPLRNSGLEVERSRDAPRQSSL